MNIKAALFKQCEMAIDDKLLTVQNVIREIQNSLLTETKSSAGDKHETGRAMLHIEREKAGQQLAEIQKTREILSRIDINKIAKVISLGSIIYTSEVNYYLAISAGEIMYENQIFYAISAVAPIGKLLLSKKEGEEIEFRGHKILIEKIL